MYHQGNHQHYRDSHIDSKEKFEWRRKHCNLTNQSGIIWECLKRMAFEFKLFDLSASIPLIHQNQTHCMTTWLTKLRHIKNIRNCNVICNDDGSRVVSSASEHIAIIRKEIEYNLIGLHDDMTQMTNEIKSVLDAYLELKAQTEQMIRSLISSSTSSLNDILCDSQLEIDHIDSVGVSNNGERTGLKTLIRHEKSMNLIESVQRTLSLESSKHIIEENIKLEQRRKRLILTQQKKTKRCPEVMNAKALPQKVIYVTSDNPKKKHDLECAKISLQMRRIAQIQKGTENVIDATRQKFIDEVDQISQRPFIEERYAG
jgi:hypothetical protein